MKMLPLCELKPNLKFESYSNPIMYASRSPNTMNKIIDKCIHVK